MKIKDTKSKKKYTLRTNPGLWQKGMGILKGTNLFSEVKNDPNYADIADDDNLILNEVHARITGEMAQKVLERIAKDKAIDWDEELFDYIYDEFGFGKNSAFAKEKTNGHALSDYKAFLTQSELKKIKIFSFVSFFPKKSLSFVIHLVYASISAAR